MGERGRQLKVIAVIDEPAGGAKVFAHSGLPERAADGRRNDVERTLASLVRRTGAGQS